MIAQKFLRTISLNNISRGLSTTATRNMPIKVGDAVPSVELAENTPGEKVNLAELCGTKKAVIFGVPGAFTPGCSKTHLPGYIADFDKIKEKGVELIACVAVNDPFVMEAWGKAHGADGKVRMLADTCADLTKALDVELDATPILGNVRCQRFSMVVEGGKVTAFNVEPDKTGLTCTLSNEILKQI